jgi:hypothetical protein
LGKFDCSNADAIAALGIETGGRKRHLLDFSDLLIDVFAFCIFTDDLCQTFFIDDDGERNVIDLVAFTGGRG